MGIQKLITAAIGMLITVAAPPVLVKTGIDITPVAGTVTQLVLGGLTSAGVFMVTNK